MKSVLLIGLGRFGRHMQLSVLTQRPSKTQPCIGIQMLA